MFSLFSGPANPSLQDFQSEAERLLNRSIIIVDAPKTEMGPALGFTYCDLNPVRIMLLEGMPSEVRTATLAHELGHAYLCGSGVLSITTNRPGPSVVNAQDLSARVGSTVASCYIDPLADSVAAKHGFDTSAATDQFAKTSNSHSDDEVRSFVVNNGDLGADFVALTIYCYGLRPHKIALVHVSDGLGKVEVLKKLGSPSCNTSESCFVLTRKLRDALQLQDNVLIKDPSTGQFE